MEILPCQGCRGLCCGPVPITQLEYKKIKKKIKSMPNKIREELRNQERYKGTCIFFDMNRDQCGIYSVRPKVCRMFGHYKGLACFRKPEAAVKEIEEVDQPMGILSEDILWKNFD